MEGGSSFKVGLRLSGLLIFGDDLKEPARDWVVRALSHYIQVLACLSEET